MRGLGSSLKQLQRETSGTVADFVPFSRFLGTTVKDDVIKVHRRTRTERQVEALAKLLGHIQSACVCV